MMSQYEYLLTVYYGKWALEETRIARISWSASGWPGRRPHLFRAAVKD